MWQVLKRVLRHRWQADDAAARAIPHSLMDKLAALVKDSEAKHSGEIRIYVEAGLPLSYLRKKDDIAIITRQRALTMFGKLRMWDTAGNNGVLIYLLLAERRIEIVADRGLNDLVAPNAWQMLAQSMGSAFKAGDFELGLMQSVRAVSDLLSEHFAVSADQSNPNELPDQPLLG
jgi:uncharacterized membrane protein